MQETKAHCSFEKKNVCFDEQKSTLTQLVVVVVFSCFPIHVHFKRESRFQLVRWNKFSRE